jgi:hypothetical protein
MLYFRKFFRWHALAWLTFAAYSLLGDFIVKGHQFELTVDLWLSVSFLLAEVATFYFGYLLVFPRALRVGRVGLLALGLLGAGLLFTSVRAILEEGLYPWLLGFRNYDPDTSLGTYLFDGFYYALPMLVISAALWASEEALRRERENQQLTAARRSAELAFLQTQLNPHFLYNTLNALFGQAYAVNKSLAGSIMKLSELMRYMLRDTPDGQVDLAEEVQYLENFLALYRLRYPDRLHAELTVTGDPAGHRVAPLLLVPFVENAFKHGVLDDPATPVQMQLILTSDAVAFTVENQRHDYQPDATSCIGLRNLRRRLELLYPNRFACTTGPMGTQYRAHLRLDVAAGTPVSAVPAPMLTELVAALTVVSA